MPYPRPLALCRSVLCWAILAAAPASAAATDDWRYDLVRQLDAEQGCTLAFLSQVVERDVDGRSMVMAKAHCEDRRTFDAVRHQKDEPFELKACGVVEGIAC